MTPQARIRRIGWFATLAICTALYLLLHLKVHSISSDVVKSEREIVQLEEQNLLLETEFLTRSSQAQLASWNRVDFGFAAPKADQFIENDRQLAALSSPRGADAPAPIMLASATSEEETPPFPKLVSPLTGEPLDPELVQVADAGDRADGVSGRPARVAMVASIAHQTVRIPLAASASMGGAGQ
jgi:hypothetical protein